MYAIFEDGSRQYRVEPGATVVIDYRAAELGQQLVLDKVLLLSSGADTLRPHTDAALNLDGDRVIFSYSRFDSTPTPGCGSGICGVTSTRATEPRRSAGRSTTTAPVPTSSSSPTPTRSCRVRTPS